MAPQPLIEVSHLTKAYTSGEETVQALRDVSLRVNRGEFVAVMGSSGSGKSTLLHVLGLLDRQTSGTYHFDGQALEAVSDAERSAMRGAKMGFVFQAFHLLPGMDTVGNVALPLVYAGVAPKERVARAKEALTTVGLAHRFTHVPNQLSGGERQRVAIARALVNEPSIVFADEPTGNLDSRTGEEVLRLFSRLHAAGRTILLITHEREAAAYAERIVTMKDGLIVRDERNTDRRFESFEK
jgi:putative ABC transport system ATP-binding protein